MACDPVKLKELVEGSGLSYSQNSVSYIFECPKCGKAKKLYIRKKDGRFVCWRCKETEGYSGRPEFALSDLLRIPLSQVREKLYGLNDVTSSAELLDLGFDAFFGEGDEMDLEVIPEQHFPYHYYPLNHPFASRGRAYLEGRGIPLEVAQQYHLRYSPPDRKVIFPIEVGDRVVGWQGRLIVPNRVWIEEKQEFREVPKILSSKDIPSGRTVMFEHRLIDCDHAVICEGPIDAIKAHLCGGNVATMGKGVGRGQIDLIRRHNPQRIYIALDPDAARETERLVRAFSDLEVYLLEAPAPYHDLGDMPFEAVYELFRGAKRVVGTRIFVFFGFGK